MNSDTAKHFLRTIALTAMTLATTMALTNTAIAEELRVRQQVYRGTVTGKVHEVRQVNVDLQEICKALRLPCQKIGDGYWIPVTRASDTPGTAPTHIKAGTVQISDGKHSLALVADGDKAMVNLKELSDALEGKLVYNKDTEILDFYLLAKVEATAAGWGAASSHYRLLFFGNDTAPACKHFKPSLKQYEKDSKTPVIWIDTAKTNSDDYRNFIHYFQGNMIPHTVLISRDGKVWKRWTGSIPLGKFATEANSIIKIPR